LLQGVELQAEYNNRYFFEDSSCIRSNEGFVDVVDHHFLEGYINLKRFKKI